MKRLISSIFALTLAACGGGGSSSSGSGGGGSSTPAPFAGTYNGFATTTISAPGLAPMPANGTIRIVIDAQGNVTSDPTTQFAGTGALSGDTFTVMVPAAAFNQPGVACTGVVMISGTVSDNTITGTISASGLTCNGVPFQINGSYEVTRVPSTARASQPIGTSMMESLRNSIR